MAAKVTRRQATLADLKEIDDMCRSVHFEVGYHNVKLYFQASPESWFVFVNDENGKIVAIAATNQLSNGTQYGYITIVLDEYKGRGLGRQLMPDLPTGPFMGSSNFLSILLPGMSGVVWLEKRHGLYGNVRRRQIDNLPVPEKIHGVEIRTADADSTRILLDYDAHISKVERREFVSKWSTPLSDEFGRSVLAVDETTGQCLGYGTLRLFSDYYGIQPLYADSDEIARALMITLVKWCLKEDDANLYMPLMASKREALKFCYDLGMFITSTEVRNCSGYMLPYIKSVPVEKLYAVHEYYPV